MNDGSTINERVERIARESRDGDTLDENRNPTERKAQDAANYLEKDLMGGAQGDKNRKATAEYIRPGFWGDLEKTVQAFFNGEFARGQRLAGELLDDVREAIDKLDRMGSGEEDPLGAMGGEAVFPLLDELKNRLSKMIG